MNERLPDRIYLQQDRVPYTKLCTIGCLTPLTVIIYIRLRICKKGEVFFMQFLLYLSNFMIPIVIFYIVGYGLCSHTDVFGAFVKGAEDGFRVVLKVLPTLIGLMMAIGILRASGLLETFSAWISPMAEKIDFSRCSGASFSDQNGIIFGSHRSAS